MTWTTAQVEQCRYLELRDEQDRLVASARHDGGAWDCSAWVYLGIDLRLLSEWSLPRTVADDEVRRVCERQLVVGAEMAQREDCPYRIDTSRPQEDTVSNAFEEIHGWMVGRRFLLPAHDALGSGRKAVVRSASRFGDVQISRNLRAPATRRVPPGYLEIDPDEPDNVRELAALWRDLAPLDDRGYVDWATADQDAEHWERYLAELRRLQVDVLEYPPGERRWELWQRWCSCEGGWCAIHRADNRRIKAVSSRRRLGC